MEAYACITPIEWAEKGVGKTTCGHSRQNGGETLPASLHLQEHGAGRASASACEISHTQDPHHRILARQRSHYTHYYFYIRDEFSVRW